MLSLPGGVSFLPSSSHVLFSFLLSFGEGPRPEGGGGADDEDEEEAGARPAKCLMNLAPFCPLGGLRECYVPPDRSPLLLALSFLR